MLEGFGFGAALLAMFMRVGGGIFTKAADVGADLVGKVEQGIPEDDPRNAATIADNVGDNVGDCAGMAADLFESYAVTLVAALILGKAAFGEHGLVFPLIVPAIGAITAVARHLRDPAPARRERPGRDQPRLLHLRRRLRGALRHRRLRLPAVPRSPSSTRRRRDVRRRCTGDPRLVAIGAVILGIVARRRHPLADRPLHRHRHASRPCNVARTSLTGAATVVLSGIGVGLESAVYTAVIIAAAVYGAFLLGGGSVIVSLFLIALAGCGLLTTVGVIVAMDTFGPVSDNAQGIAEMSGDVDGEGAQILTELDAVGNTTKAITKGIAIATAVLAATALFGSYNDSVQAPLDQASPARRSEQAADGGRGLPDRLPERPGRPDDRRRGGVPVLRSGDRRRHPGRGRDRVRGAAAVPRASRDHGRHREARVRPVVDICTRDSLRELATPGLLAAMAPIAVGFGLGVGPLAGYLAGAIGAGVLMAVFLANSGGSWDNAKKIVEDGAFGGKGSDAHAATVIGDTVGDPFKDTAGPAINPLIKVMNLVSVLIAPAVVQLSTGDSANTPLRIGDRAGRPWPIIIGAVTVSKRRTSAMHDEFPRRSRRPRRPDGSPCPTGASNGCVGPVGEVTPDGASVAAGTSTPPVAHRLRRDLPTLAVDQRRKIRRHLGIGAACGHARPGHPAWPPMPAPFRWSPRLLSGALAPPGTRSAARARPARSASAWPTRARGRRRPGPGRHGRAAGRRGPRPADAAAGRRRR